MAPFPVLSQAPGRPVFRGAGGMDVVCGSCRESLLLENIHPESVFDITIKCATCGAIEVMPELPPGRGLTAMRRQVGRDHAFVGTFVLDMHEVIVGQPGAERRQQETGEVGFDVEAIHLDVAGLRRVADEARETFVPILRIIEPRARRQTVPEHALPRLIHLLERITEIRSNDEMARLVRLATRLRRTTLAFTRWQNDPEGGKLIRNSKSFQAFDHNTALLEVATVFAAAGLGPELVPTRDGENTVDLALRLSATNLIEVEAKTPRPLQFPAVEPFDPSEIPPPRETIKKALDDARSQFSQDGILAIAGDFWVGGLDAYALAAENLLAAPLPAEASDSARALRSNLLGVLLASLGFEVADSRDVSTRLFLRWVANPAYDGPIVLTWHPETDGRMSIRIREPGASTVEADDDFARYEENAFFNPARFRLINGDETRVQIEGLIGPTPDTPQDQGAVTFWVLPANCRPPERFDFDVASEGGFSVVTILPDGRVRGDPTVGWVDLHGVEFPVEAPATEPAA